MAPNKNVVDQIILQLVRTAVDLKRGTGFVPESAELASETEILGAILAQYLEKSGRAIAETAYAALDKSGLTVEALGLAELWRRMNPEQNDLWAPEEDDLDGNGN